MYYNIINSFLKGISAMLNKVKVNICGKEYTLQTEEEPSYIFSLARYVEKKINEITSSNTSVSQASAAVMVAFMAIDELNQTNRNLDNLRGELKEYVDEADRVTSERDNAVRELEIIKTKISQLEGNKKLKQLKDSI